MERENKNCEQKNKGIFQIRFSGFTIEKEFQYSNKFNGDFMALFVWKFRALKKRKKKKKSTYCYGC